MARSYESYDPSSSSNIREKLPFWERTKDGVKKVVVKCMAGVAIIGTTLSVTGCGRGDRIAVPEQSPSSSASLDPS